MAENLRKALNKQRGNGKTQNTSEIANVSTIKSSKNDTAKID